LNENKTPEKKKNIKESFEGKNSLSESKNPRMTFSND
jgi:hypothetical protein